MTGHEANGERKEELLDEPKMHPALLWGFCSKGNKIHFSESQLFRALKWVAGKASHIFPLCLKTLGSIKGKSIC